MFKTNLRLRIRSNTVKKEERWLFKHIRFLLRFVAPQLRIVGLKGTLRFAYLWVFLTKTKEATHKQERAKRIGELVQIAARKGMFQYDCLERSVTIWILLKREQIDADLRLGVRKRTDKAEAHAWVEVAGEVVSETFNPHDRYQAFPQAFTLKTFRSQPS